MGILLAIMAALFLSGMQILLKKSYKELNPSIAFFFDSVFGLLIWIPIGFIFGGKIEEIPECLIYAVISAILSEALVFYAVSKGELSIATVLIATYPIYTLLFSYIINNEVLLPLQAVFVLVTIVGTILTCIEEDFKIKNMKNITTIIPILTAVAIGLSDTLTKKNINDTSSFSFLIAIAIVQLPVALIYLKISKQSLRNIKKEFKEDKLSYKYSILGSFLNILGTGSLLISFNYALASIASPLTAIYTPIVLIYSFVFLKERISKVKLLGTILALVRNIWNNFNGINKRRL